MTREDFERICREHPEWIPDDIIEEQFTDRGLMTDEVLETYRPFLEEG
jgi:hypothetical protein